MGRSTLLATILILIYGSVFAQNIELTLPVYHLEIDSVYLEELYYNPSTNDYFPAVFSLGEYQYDCEVRFRGAMSLNLPKKSWRIQFSDNNNIFGAEKINLNAEYLDRSLMRNYLAFKLFQYLNYPSPNTEHVSFFVNDVYMGVFVQVEVVDESFLERNNRLSGNLYKAKNHGASMAPLATYNSYFGTWNKKIGDGLDYTDIQLLFSKILYWTTQDFEASIGDEINVDNILNYFAIEFVIVSYDCFTKNLFLYFNPDLDVYEIFPWDNDATFGNHWSGDYHSSYAQFYLGSHLKNQILFQRLMENETWRNEFWGKVSMIVTQGFSYLNLEIDSTYDYIRNDVYQDTFKVCSNQEFDDEILRLHDFLSTRYSFLDGVTYFERISLSDFFCSNSYPNPNNPNVTFRVTSQQPQSVFVKIIRDLDLNQSGSSYDIEVLELFDDGNHDDGEAGDLDYANSQTFSDQSTGIFPFCFAGSYFDYPANGLDYINYVRTNTFALIQSVNPQDFNQHLEIGYIYNMGSDYFVELRNSSAHELDLSYCHFQTGDYIQKFIFPANTLLNPYDTLIITTNKTFALHYFNQFQTVGNLFFDIDIGDTVRILSPTLSMLASKHCNEYSPIQIETPDIVINEINYHSSNDFNPEDWIEFFNPQSFPVDLSDWYFRDEEDNHIFLFPNNTTIEPEGYLVLCRNKSAFSTLFPNINNFAGDFDFGLSGKGELVRLYSTSGTIVDSLVYDDSSPWPTEPDGSGPTLELLNPSLDNTLGKNWVASVDHGTPGTVNGNVNGNVVNFFLHQNYPNPFKPVTNIRFSLPIEAEVSISIYNLQGREVSTLISGYMDSGYHSVVWNANSYSSGVYLIRMTSGEFTQTQKVLLVK